MVYKVQYSKTADKQLAKLHPQEAKRIIKFFKEKIKDDARLHGTALKPPFNELWRYRVGRYRMICKIQDDVCLILVLKIGHRKEVYKKH